MEPERWQQIDRILADALEEEGQRPAFLDTACGDDQSLRQEVENLLTAHQEAGNLLEDPAVGMVAAGFARDEGPSFIGRQMGSYEIVSHLGSGGMGEVYQATDTKLGREVAIKVLAADFAQDPDRLARFKREAQLLAALNHPNIATIHGLEEDQGVSFLVMELVEGKTLAERLKKGPLPLEETLEIARQMAEGLEAAHQKGIVHRDLKPANVKVTAEGRVKVLDFGLAKALVVDEPQLDLSQSPTITNAPTNQGVILGTAPYMSPEQARGEAVDRQTDIWAFGCVVYELLTGKQTFEGRTVSDTIAAILGPSPDWQLLPARTPRTIRILLRRCLEKDAKRRLHDMADARIEISDVLDGTDSTSLAEPLARVTGWHTVVGWSIASLLVGVAAVTLLWNPEPPTPGPVTRIRIGLAPLENFIPLLLTQRTMAISPDGHHIVFGAIRNGIYQLHLRTLDEAEAKPMPGTEGFSYATAPFFSPDGKWVGYNSDGKLKKIPLEGGPAIDLVEIESHAYPGVTWGPNDTIVFGRMEGGLMQVSAAGEGTPEPLTTLDVDRGELSHRLPSFLPDGKGVLFTIRRNSRWDEAEIAVLSLATGRYEVLAENGADPRYVSTGHLVYAQLGTLMAAPFDLERQEVTGPSVPVLSNIRQAVNTRIFDTGYTQYSVSESGSLVYISGGIFPDGKRTPVWVDRRGVEEPVPIPPRAYGQPRLSPDGRRLAFNTWGMVAVPLREPEVDRDVWVHDIERGGLTRLTFEGSNGRPVWTPDGTQVVFGSDRRGGPMNLYVKSAGGIGQARRLMTSPQNQVAGDFSPDGRELVFLQGGDMWVLRFDGDHEPRPLLETPFGEGRPAFSPDGRWLAYTSDEYDHRNAVYVIPYPDAGKRYQISNGIGREPVWSGNGRELYYHRPKEWTSENELQEVFAVDIQTEPEFRAGLPRKLFEGRYPGGSWDVTSDGQHFVMMRKDESPMVEATEFHLILNWFEELKRLVPTGN